MAERPISTGAFKPGVIDRLRAEIRVRQMSPRTERVYVGWARRFRQFVGRGFSEVREPDVRRFIEHIVRQGHVSASTQNQALAALLFLFERVLGRPLLTGSDMPRGRFPERKPVVLTGAEVNSVLAALKGDLALIGGLLYGSGLRLLEALRLRVKDLDFESCQVLVRDGKGRKDRITVLPASLIPDLKAHLVRVRTQHDMDVAAGAGHVELPDAVVRKLASASRDWIWQWVFPSKRLHVDDHAKRLGRHHLHETVGKCPVNSILN